MANQREHDNNKDLEDQKKRKVKSMAKQREEESRKVKDDQNRWKKLS